MMEWLTLNLMVTLNKNSVRFVSRSQTEDVHLYSTPSLIVNTSLAAFGVVRFIDKFLPGGRVGEWSSRARTVT
jgi:hypothetical protein